MRNRFQGIGSNLLVLGASALVFLLAFLFLQGFVEARTPPTLTILVAGRSYQIGDPIRSEDLEERVVYADESAGLFIPVSEAAELAGAHAALPIRRGQPLLRDLLISPGGASDRFSALLVRFPGHSLFPLPLEAGNVHAPPAETVFPGDRVGITVVISGRPQPPATPTPGGFTLTLPGAPAEALATGVPTPIPEPVDDGGLRSFPPLAKDLFPGGVLVVAVRGLPETGGADDPAPAFNTRSGDEMLILLIADDSRERLSLALQQGNGIYVSLLPPGASGAKTEGFTYWDFEAWFREDRLPTPLPQAP